MTTRGRYLAFFFVLFAISFLWCVFWILQLFLSKIGHVWLQNPGYWQMMTTPCMLYYRMHARGKIVIKLFLLLLERNAVLATTRFSVFGLRRFSASAECESHVKSICINHHAIHSVFLPLKINQKIISSRSTHFFSSGASWGPRTGRNLLWNILMIFFRGKIIHCGHGFIQAGKCKHMYCSYHAWWHAWQFSAELFHFLIDIRAIFTVLILSSKKCHEKKFFLLSVLLAH